MSNINKWAFSAVTGYEGNDFGSADVDGWEEMSKEELISSIEGQIEFAAPENLEGELDADKVAETIIAFRNCNTGSSNDLFWIYKRLDD